MKKISILIVVLLLTAVLHHGAAKKVATLEGLMRPDAIAIGNDRFYATEGVSIFIYSMKDFSLLKKFGKQGEGPREFKASPFGTPMVVMPYDDKIYVSSSAKLSLFTKDGKYIEEYKINPFTVIIPFKDKYMYTGTTGDQSETLLTVNLYDKNFKKLKELYVSDFQVGQNASFNYPLTNFAFVPYKDRIYLAAGKDGFAIDVFDEEGKKLYRIKKDYAPVKLHEQYKEKTINWYKNHPNFKQFWEYFKTRIKFKSEYPAIRDMIPLDDRIYVLTYKMKGELTECIILDLKGNELKRAYVLAPEQIGMDFYPKYTIHNKAFYTLLENEDEETWELFKDDAIK